MVEYVYARHDFAPEHEDEISFRAGERIEVITRDDLYSDGWWEVRSLSSSLSAPPSPCPSPVSLFQPSPVLMAFSRQAQRAYSNFMSPFVIRRLS